MSEKHVIVRYGEIATKSDKVRTDMEKVLRQRVTDRLKYEGISFEKVRTAPGRIIVEGTNSNAVDAVKNIPGVVSVSLASRTEPKIDKITQEALKLDLGKSFGANTNRSGDHSFDSMDVNKKVGGALDKEKEASVDLDNPETWVNIDIRNNEAFVFTQKLSGPGGMPVGSSSKLGALISGGIDSPVSAYEMMKRGCDVEPFYFYNSPFTAEDHLLRFEVTVKNLEKFHPAKKWSYTVIDMSEINEELSDMGSGRMILHRYLMFRIADELAKEKGLKGLVTGESMSQKSSQTASNMALTSKATELPIHRPLISSSKEEITEKAREIETFEDAKIDSACRDLSPDKPATRLSEERFEQLKSEIDVEDLIEKAKQNAEKKEF